VDRQLAAVVAVADPIKETTVDAIRYLHEAGLRVAMITGDNTHTANAIARQCGIDEVKAEVLPDGKVDAVKALQEGGRPWPSSAMASTTPRRWHSRMWALPSARGQTLPLSRRK